uniref:Methyltransferase type 12 n=1 Tax=Cyanothece sp. (strain PCC 7425 / ATCC 29141) TaxID=395961 RepID=B8HV75_CYAP4
MSHELTCPVCGAKHWDVFFKMPEMPIYCNVLWSEQHAARTCAKGNIHLAFCPNCGFIGNVAFDPLQMEYTQAYENALDFSPTFQNYAGELAARLVKTYSLYSKDLIEIGCGKGEFLFSLCEMGNNRGIGFDPTYVQLPDHELEGTQVQIIQDFYSEQYAGYPCDFIYCRHTLEHIKDPISLIKLVREVIGDRSNIASFFEVPNALDTFQNMAIWDIIYEHCCYFTAASISYAFSSCGFQIHEIWKEYQGQFLCLEAKAGEVNYQITDNQAQEVKQLEDKIRSFSSKFDEIVKNWNRKLETIVGNNKRVVIWGGGSKGISFLNLLETADLIKYVVDINPRKVGMYTSVTAHKIIAPSFLKEYEPDVVLVMNNIYIDEIRKMLDGLGLHPELLSLSDHC